MATFEIQGPNGEVFEVEAPDQNAAISAFQSMQGGNQAVTADIMRESGGGYRGAQIRNNALSVLGNIDPANMRPAEAAAYQALQSGAAQDQQTIGSTDAAYRGALQGATFNFADEAMGLVGGREAIDVAREKNRQSQEAFPKEFGRGKLAGGVASGLASSAITAPLAAGGSALGTLLRSALLGGAEGAVWGAGEGEGIGGKAKEALRDGAIGAGAGVVVPAATMAAGRGARFVGDMMGGALNRGNAGRANRAIASTMQKAGMTGDDAMRQIGRAAQEGQPDFRLMDALGVAGQRRASGIVRAGGDGAEEMAAYLSRRQAGQPERIAAFTDDAFDMGGQSAEQISRTMQKGRSAAADMNYNAARQNAGPVDVRGAVAVIDDRIGGMQGSNIAGDSIDAKLSGFRNRLMADPAPNGEISRELSDFNRVLNVKQDVQDAIGVATRQGRNNEVRELKALQEALDMALEEASPDYRLANDSFAAASRPIDAIETGRKMAVGKRRATDTIQQFNSMTPDEQAGARVGYGDTMIGRVEANASPTANRAKVFASPKVEAETDRFAAMPELFRRQLERENAMWETQNRALQGSRTADNLQDVQDVGMIADASRAARDVATGNIGNALANTAQGAARLASGQNEATRTLMAQVLMNPNPQAALQQIESMVQRGQITRAVADQILRSVGRGTISSSNSP